VQTGSQAAVRHFIDLLAHPDDQAGNARVRRLLTGLLSARAREAAAPA